MKRISPEEFLNQIKAESNISTKNQNQQGYIVYYYPYQVNNEDPTKFYLAVLTMVTIVALVVILVVKK
jgi:hypothetical protein